MHTCAVISCDSNTHSENVTLFRIPTDQDEARGWIHFLTQANSDFISTPTSAGKLYVCSKHFRKCCLYPCNPRRRLIAGHYPSVLEGKVVENVNSKCALVSADENLQVYKQPIYRSAQEKQRTYLIKQLTSFSVQRKIVIGSASGDRNHIVMKSLNGNCSVKTKNTIAVQKSTVCPGKCLIHNAHQAHTPNVTSEEDNETIPLSKGQWNNKNNEAVLVKQGIFKPKSIKVEPRKVAKRARSFITRPSSETKLRLLLRDNINLKKTVRVIEKKMDAMDKRADETEKRMKDTEIEVKRLRDAARDLEKRYKNVVQRFQRYKRKNKLLVKQQEKMAKKHSSSGTVVAKVSNCKCALIDVVDISED